MINEIAGSLDENSFDYKEELKDLPRIISEEDWTESHKREYGEYFGKRLDLVAQDKKFFYYGTRCILERSMIRNIIQEGHSLYIGINRMQKRVAELFWWPILAKEIEDCIKADRIQRMFSIPMVKVDLPGKPWAILLSILKDLLISNTDQNFYLLK